MPVVRRSSQGDHKGAPLLWTSLASRFVGIVGAMACPRPGWGGRPASVALLSRPFACSMSFANQGHRFLSQGYLVVGRIFRLVRSEAMENRP
jgi:hypothetical protein